MHGSKVAAFVAAITLPLVQGQSISLNDLPKCAQGAATTGLTSTKCDLTDIACICSAVEFVTTLTTQVKSACSTIDQQVTLALAQGLCGRYGITLNVPAVPAAANAPSSSPASPASVASLAASSAPATSSTATGIADDNTDDNYQANPDTAGTSAAATASSSEPVSSAPVSPSASPTSPNDSTLAATLGEEASRSPTSSGVVYDTKSVIPSATIASYPSMTTTDASSADAQVPTSTTAYRNSTTNTTVAASSPIPFVGAAVKGKVQGFGMALMVVLGFLWEL
ncbi:MAG: hypothetical protein Q9166_005413 [cf. Caloplaca sp. 2 TL-2023]